MEVSPAKRQRTEEDDDLNDVPSDYDGDPDEYHASRRARTVAPSAGDDDEDYKAYQKEAEEAAKQLTAEVTVQDQLPFVGEGGSRFRLVSRKAIHITLDMIEIRDLLRLAVLSRRWNKELEEQSYWSKRYISDLGEDRFRRALFLNSSNGWTAKQHFFWSLVSTSASLFASSKRYAIQRNVWCCIMRERKRKYLQTRQENSQHSIPYLIPTLSPKSFLAQPGTPIPGTPLPTPMHAPSPRPSPDRIIPASPARSLSEANLNGGISITAMTGSVPSALPSPIPSPARALSSSSSDQPMLTRVLTPATLPPPSPRIVVRPSKG